MASKAACLVHLFSQTTAGQSESFAQAGELQGRNTTRAGRILNSSLICQAGSYASCETESETMNPVSDLSVDVMDDEIIVGRGSHYSAT
jgi:hypothetical protein